MISRRQIDVGKVIPRPCEYFGVHGFGMVLVGEPQSAVQDRIWKSGRSSLTQDAAERGHVVISRGQIYIGKVSQRPHEYFGVARFSMALVDEPQLAVQDLVWAK